MVVGLAISIYFLFNDIKTAAKNAANSPTSIPKYIDKSRVLNMKPIATTIQIPRIKSMRLQGIFLKRGSTRAVKKGVAEKEISATDALASFTDP